MDENFDFMEDLWESVFEVSDYTSSVADEYWYLGDYGNPNSGTEDHWTQVMANGVQICENGECEWVQTPSSYYEELSQVLGEDSDFFAQIYNSDMETARDMLLDLDSHGDSVLYALGLKLEDQINHGIMHDMDNISDLWIEVYEEYQPWKDKYSKYVSPYDAKKEGYLKQDTKLDIENFTSQFGDTLMKTQSSIGRLNLDSGRAKNIWGDVKQGLDLQIKKANLAEDMGISNLREAYKRNFYGSIMEIAEQDPGLLDPDQA
ncbi:MAG: hypothetical protein Unbinned1966contig1000_4 [Prokaryotic dsDNA virus sp.]|nr:MAG: hypothetical protein Unbinned1966contig1000_4 [Prokaryotic dsDNA virus sp.]|tara:strand:+ start:1664 stop:2446 length:783 start_codon:yes stop_codon:yes gene_type:complete